MGKKSWVVSLKDGAHTVKVRRKPWLAIGEVSVDDNRVAVFTAKAGSLTIFKPRQQPFEIAGIPCMLEIRANFFGYDYKLYVDGELVL